MRSWKAASPLGASLVVAVALTVLADEARAQDLEDPKPPRQQRSRDVLERIDAPRPEPGWIETHLSLHRKGGLQYSDRFSVGDRTYGFVVRGPFRGKVDRKELGLSFEIRF
jgi:hypothetical protein